MPLGFVSRQLLQQQNTRCLIGRELFYMNIEWIQEVNKTFRCLHNEYLCTQWQVGYPLAMITAVHSLYMVWLNRAFDDRHWGVPKFSIGLKSGLTSGQGFTFASLCSRKSLVYFAVWTQVLSCLISGFGVGSKRWHKKRLKNIVDILGSYYTIASTWTNMLKHSEVKLNSPMQCCLVLPRNPFLPYNHRNSVLIVCTKLSSCLKNRHS